MKAWKKLEEYIPTYLKNWKRQTKLHYGHSICDLKGNGFKGECKHYKKFRIHTILDEAEAKYHSGIILFTKEKGSHYTPENIIVHFRLNLFKEFLGHLQTVLTLTSKKGCQLNQETVDNRFTILLKDMSYTLETVLLSYRKMKKIIKEMEEVK